MIIRKNEIIETTKTYTVDFGCNKCGTELKEDYFINIEYSGGMDSQYIQDCASISFEICEKCFVDFARSLKHPPHCTNIFKHDSSPVKIEDVVTKKYLEETKTNGNLEYGC